MPRFLKSSFLWQFVGGFAIGAVGLFTLHPAEARQVISAPVHAVR